MFNSTTIKTFRTMTVSATIAAFALAGCGSDPVGTTTLKSATKQSTLTAKKPGNDLIMASAAIRTHLVTSDAKHIVTVRDLDVQAGPTIAIYPPVAPTVFDFTARLDVTALDDRLAQYVVTGTYSKTTGKVTITTRKPAVF